jgi:hypothetical protein
MLIPADMLKFSVAPDSEILSLLRDCLRRMYWRWYRQACFTLYATCATEINAVLKRPQGSPYETIVLELVTAYISILHVTSAAEIPSFSYAIISVGSILHQSQCRRR